LLHVGSLSFPPTSSNIFVINFMVVWLLVKAETIIYQLLELKSEWVARVLSGRAALPREDGCCAGALAGRMGTLTPHARPRS
jgi:hypothetical protein